MHFFKSESNETNRRHQLLVPTAGTYYIIGEMLIFVHQNVVCMKLFNDYGF